MFVVIVEYGPKRTPNVYGSFDTVAHAQAYLDAWPDKALSNKMGYFVPHSDPRHFKRATIRRVMSEKINPPDTFQEVHFLNSVRVEFRTPNNVTFLTVYQVKQGGDYNAKMGNHYWTMPLEQWRKYVSYRVNDTKR